MTGASENSQDRHAQSPLHLLNCTLDSLRSKVQPFLPNQRSLLSHALPKPSHRRPTCQPRRQEGVSFRGTHFAAAIPGDGVVEQVFTTGISSFLNLYNTVLIGRIILTWFPNAPPAIVQPLSTVTDPYLNLFRGIIPPIGGTFDLSPILAFIALDLFTNAAAALPCELDDGKAPEQSQGNSNPLQMLVPSKFAMNLRTRMARNRRQRVWIALEEKKLNFSLVEVAIKDPDTGLWRDINKKPSWFIELNPLGKVPVIAYRQNGEKLVSIYESLICNEFLEDFAPNPEYPALFPLESYNRARARLLIDRFDRKFVPNFYGLLVKKGEEARAACSKAMAQELLWLEGQTDAEGPYYLGKQFSAVDCTLLPWFIRLYILKHYRGFEMPKECKRLVAWYQKAMQRESVQSTLQCPDKDTGYEELLLNHYSKYADGTANSTSARDFG